MKARHGFVSNSSSSSFLIVNKTKQYKNIIDFITELNGREVAELKRSKLRLHRDELALMNATHRLFVVYAKVMDGCEKSCYDMPYLFDDEPPKPKKAPYKGFWAPGEAKGWRMVAGDFQGQYINIKMGKVGETKSFKWGDPKAEKAEERKRAKENAKMEADSVKWREQFCKDCKKEKKRGWMPSNKLFAQAAVAIKRKSKDICDTCQRNEKNSEDDDSI